MRIVYRPVSDKDLDMVFALNDIDHVRTYLDDKREWCESIKQGRHLAEDTETGHCVMHLPQGAPTDAYFGYLFVWNGQILLSRKSLGSRIFPIGYISPGLIAHLDELTVFLRTAFTQGSDFLLADRAPDISWGNSLEFRLSDATTK